MNKIKPFGDHIDDGLVQISFSLPIKQSSTGKTIAQSIAKEMGIRNAEVVYDISLGQETSYYIIYGKVDYTIDRNEIKQYEIDFPISSKEEIEIMINKKLGHKITVIGASTGTDTHSVGIDAIFNHKGYNGHPGLEAYQGFVVHNLGSQVPNEKLIAEAVRVNAHAVLVSQTVTQQDLHIENLTELVDMLEAESLRDRFILICGGPRISDELAKELGYDAGFSKGTYAESVASFISLSLLAKQNTLITV